MAVHPARAAFVRHSLTPIGGIVRGMAVPLTVLFFTAVLLTGCGDDHTNAGRVHGGTPSPPQHSPTILATLNKTTPGTPPSSSSILPALRATNGANVAACIHEQCQVQVSGTTTIPLDGTYGITRLSITVADNKVSLNANNLPVLGGFVAGCYAYFRSDGAGAVCGPGANQNPLEDSLAVEIVAILDGQAVVDLSRV